MESFPLRIVDAEPGGGAEYSAPPPEIYRHPRLGPAARLAYWILWEWAGRREGPARFKPIDLAIELGAADAANARFWLQMLEREGCIEWLTRSGAGSKEPSEVYVRAPAGLDERLRASGRRDPQRRLFDEQTKVPDGKLSFGAEETKVSDVKLSFERRGLQSEGPFSGTVKEHEAPAPEGDRKCDGAPLADPGRFAARDVQRTNERTDERSIRRDRARSSSEPAPPFEKSSVRPSVPSALTAQALRARAGEIARRINDPAMEGWMYVLAVEREWAGAFDAGELDAAIADCVATARPGWSAGRLWAGWLTDRLAPGWIELSRFRAMKARLRTLGIPWQMKWAFAIGPKR